MIVDSSAIMAILRDEPERRDFTTAILASGGGALSAGSWIEIAAVVHRRYPDLDPARVDALCTALNVVIAPVSAVQARIGADAYRACGIGAGHAARLSFGGCFAYALAKETGEPLLFKGDDFTRTGIVAAVP